MGKKSKLQTPDWINEGFDSKGEWEKAHGKKPSKKKGKTFSLKVCPKCGSSEVKVLLGNEEGKPLTQNKWECKACSWKGKDVKNAEMNEDEFLEHLEKMEGK